MSTQEFELEHGVRLRIKIINKTQETFCDTKMTGKYYKRHDEKCEEIQLQELDRVKKDIEAIKK
jgi:hypothetical protein